MQACGFRSTIEGGDANQNVIRRGLSIFDEHIEVTVLIKNARIEQLIFEFLPAAFAIGVEATAAGIEARARRIVVPSGFKAILVGRMPMAWMTEKLAGRDTEEFVRLMETESERGAEASAAVGAGGAADNRTRTNA